MKELGLIIDLNQPLVNEESVIKRSITDFYNPLARLLKSYKNISFSLNIPLSTLELWEKHGASGLISDFKDMYQSEKVELINSSPYGLSLSGLPGKAIESQLIFNEYGIGYYLGSRQGFEGEPSIMIKDVTGFLPAFNNLDSSVLNVLFDFEYSWFAIKNPFLKEYLFEINDEGRVIKGVNIIDSINEIISNLVIGDNGHINSENLDKHIFEELGNVFKNIYTDENSSGVVRLGFKNDEVIPDLNYKNLFRVYESVLDTFSKMFDQVKNVSEIMKFKNKLKIYTPNEFIDLMKKNYVKEEKDDKFLKHVLEKLFNTADNIIPISLNVINDNDLSSIKLWDLEHIKELNNTHIINNTCHLLLLSKLVPLLRLKDCKYYNEDESLNNILREEIRVCVSNLLSYIDDIEIIGLLKSED